jgi:uncharacterized protein DUF1493
MITLEDSVMDFVARFTGFKREGIRLDTTLYGDLGVAGEDGWDLMQDCGKQFQVDLTGFEFERYFGAEGVSVLAPFCLLWVLLRHPFRKRQRPEERDGLKAVRIRDLIRCAQEGRWNQ